MANNSVVAHVYSEWEFWKAIHLQTEEFYWVCSARWRLAMKEAMVSTLEPINRFTSILLQQSSHFNCTRHIENKGSGSFKSAILRGWKYITKLNHYFFGLSILPRNCNIQVQNYYCSLQGKSIQHVWHVSHHYSEWRQYPLFLTWIFLAYHDEVHECRKGPSLEGSTHCTLLTANMFTVAHRSLAPAIPDCSWATY